MTDDHIDSFRAIFDPEYRIQYTHERIKRLMHLAEHAEGDERDLYEQEIAELKRNVRLYEASADPSW